MDSVIILDEQDTFQFAHQFSVVARHFGGTLLWHPPSKAPNASSLMRYMGRLWRPLFTIRESSAPDAKLVICACEVERPRVCAQFIEFEPQSPIFAEIMCLCFAAHCREIHSRIFCYLIKSREAMRVNNSPSMSFLRCMAKLTPVFMKALVAFPDKDTKWFRIAQFVSYIGATVRLNMKFCKSFDEFDAWYDATNFDDYQSLALDKPYMSDFAKALSKLAAQYPDDSWDASPLKAKQSPSSPHSRTHVEPGNLDSVRGSDGAMAQGSNLDSFAVIAEGDESCPNS